MKGEKSATGAVCWTVASCYSLWAVFWIQFLLGVLVSLPFLPNIQPERGLWYLGTKSDIFGMSIPQLWLVLAVAFSVWALAGVWMVSRGKRGRWRMRSVTLVFSAITLGFALGMVSSREIYLDRARVVMWQHRMRIDRTIDYGGGAYRELWAYHQDHERMARLKAVIEREGGLIDRERGEVTEILIEACSELEEQALGVLHRDESLIREDVAIKPWEEARWDSEEEEWVYRVYYGFMGFVEGRLTDWATDPMVLVFDTREDSECREELRFGR